MTEPTNRESAANILRGALHPDAEPGPTRTVSRDLLAELIADYDRATMPNPVARPLVGPDELLDGGYLMEVNRRVLHPVGLALAVDRERVNTDGSFPVQLWDYRNDAEGMVFADLSDDDARAKAERVKTEMMSKRLARIMLLGRIDDHPDDAAIQPLGSRVPPSTS